MNAPPGIIKSAAKTLGDGAGLNPDLAPGGGERGEVGLVEEGGDGFGPHPCASNSNF